MEEIKPISRTTISGTKEISFQIKELSKISVGKALTGIVFDWTIIVGCFTAAFMIHNWFVWIAAVIVIAARQHGLLVMMHDAGHYRLFPNRIWNDRISDWILAWPLFSSTAGYRGYHLPHHFNLNTDQDPTLMSQQTPDWEFPKTKLGLFWLLLKDLMGMGIIENIKLLKMMKNSGQRNFTIYRIAYHIITFGVICLSGFFVPFLLLWLLPALFLLPVLLRIRSIADHHGLEGEHDLTMTRNTRVRWWERFFFFPHNVGIHLDHHLYPSVPFYNLGKLHSVLARLPEYSEKSRQTRSMLGLVNEVTQP